jgi:hypothetical protein
VRRAKFPRMKTRLLFLVGFLLLSPAVFAQIGSSEVLGTVRDPMGAAVAKASVTLKNMDTGIESKTFTDDGGGYDFLEVKVGRYSITIQMNGFETFTADGIVVDVSARQRVDATMKLGATTQTIEVKGAAAVLDTDTSDHEQTIRTEQVTELPLNGRNYADLALLSTNAVKSPIAYSFGPTGTPREGSFNVNGMRSTYNNFLLDGLDNNAYSTSNQGYSNQVVQPSPDAIAEFKVITSNYSAEYGRVGGAVVNAVMKSGTNAFHGTLYEFLRNTDLNAIGYLFAPLTAKPTLQRNQFGATVGGPIKKNKLFWFADYEGFRQLQKYLNFDSIPNMNDRAGVLPVPVVNPLTGVVYPAGTAIPIATLNPFAATVLGQLPSVAAGTARSNDLEALLLIRDYSDKFDVKLDWQINDKMTAFVRGSQRKDLQYYQPDISGPSGGNGNGDIHAIDQNLSSGYDWTLTPNSILEARFGISHLVAGKTPVFLGGESMQELYGITGLPTTPNIAGGLNSQAISGFSQLGRQTSNPQFQNPTNFDPKISYSWLHGRNSIKFGYEFMVIRTEILDINPLYGEDSYTGTFSKPTCAQLSMPTGCTIANDSASYDLADFIFGTPSIINLGNDEVVNLRQHVDSLYFQDDLRLTSKLTLNLGLRWDFATPLYERNNHYSNFDPVTDQMDLATPGSLFNRSLVHPDYKDFGPRLGLAYSFDSKTVVRTGYGISYTFFNRPGSALEGINAPQSIFGVLNQSIPPGGPVPAGFLTTQNSFTTGIDNPASFNPVNSNVVYIPSNTRWPYVQNWVLSVQREVFKNTVLEIAYNGNHSLRLPILGDYNQANPNAVGGTLGVQARRPIPTFGPITWVDPVGNNNYNGLSARFEHRFAAGLYFLNSFTWGDALGDSEQALEYYSGYVEANPQNIHNLAAEYGPSSFDVKLNNVTSVVYELPVGRNRKFGAGMHGIEDAVIGGWEVTSINTARTGTPLNVYYGPSTANDDTGLTNDYRGEEFLRPNVTGAAVSQSTVAMTNTFFAGYTFTTPPANAPFGDLSRNAFRAPDFNQWDFSLNKTFRIREGMSFQFRSEFFNFLNHTNFGIPDTKTTDAAFGTIRSTFPARQIQFAGKLLF